MSVHEVLVATRNLVAGQRCARGNPGSTNRGPGVCVEEALGRVLGFPDWNCQNSYIHASDAYLVLLGVADLPPLHRGWTPLYVWQDALPEQVRKGEVLGLLDRAIAATAPEPDLDNVTSEMEVAA